MELQRAHRASYQAYHQPLWPVRGEVLVWPGGFLRSTQAALSWNELVGPRPASPPPKPDIARCLPGTQPLLKSSIGPAPMELERSSSDSAALLHQRETTEQLSWWPAPSG